ncbi:MAG: outer rane autotransporter [Herbaspirillum sp.]|nr:outer rane autotransporter [Herbaspirillum sp.]
MKKYKHQPPLTAGRLTVLTLALTAALAAMAPVAAQAQTCNSATPISGNITTQVTWSTGDCTVTGTITVGVGATALLATGAANGTLINSGTIIGGYLGLNNTITGSIVTLNNSGTISGGSAGIYNIGTIDTLINSGTLGSEFGIYNDSGGTITTLNNSGTINGRTAIGIGNIGTITTLNNNIGGVISGLNNGISNDSGSTIDTLINNGTISGTGTISTGSTGIFSGIGGIRNGGTISTLTNNGTISANDSSGNGIFNTGTIGIIGVNSSGLYNTGAISGGNTGIFNTGTITTLTNSSTGTISGSAYAINNGGSLGTITNAGVIAGNIVNTSSNALSINGGAGAVFGTLTGFSTGSIGTITNTASNVAFGTGNQLLNDNINVGSHTVTNTGTLQINNQISITGNYSQSAAATLNIGVANSAIATGAISTDSGYGRLVVSGSATIASGSAVSLTKLNSYAFAQGQRYVVVQAASSGTNYNAGSLIYTATGFNGSVIGTSVTDGSNLDLLLTLGSSGPVNSATTSNAVSSLSGLFNYANTTGTNAALMNLSNAVAALGSPAAANRAGAQLSPTATVAASSQAAAAPTQAVLGVVGAHVDGLRVAQADGQSGVAAGESPTNVALWGQAFGGNATQDQRDGISGYHAGYNGLLIGADTMLGDNWRVGGLGSYANTSVANDGDNSGSSTHVTSYGLIGYAAYAADKWYLNMSAGAVQQQYNSVRAIGFNGFSGTANGQFNGMQYVASVQGGYPIKLASNATLTPLAGLTYSRQHQDAYTESGGNGAALSVGATNSNSVKSDIGAKLERSFATAYGALAPSAQLSWRHEYNNNRLQSVSSFAADTTGVTSFTTLGPTPVADTGVLVLGVTLTRSENVSLTARYSVEAASGYTSQTADVRLRYQF